MKDLTQGKESSQIFRFAVPMLLGNVLQQMYNVVDSIIVGKIIGKHALAAVGASFPIIFVLISLIIGITMGGTIIVSQYFGAKRTGEVKKTIDTLYIVLFISSIVTTVIGIIFSRPVFRLMHLPEEIIPDATLYLNIYLTGLVFFFGFNGTAAILRGLGDSKTPLYFLALATMLNIGLDILLILVFKMGIAGAAVATVIAHTVSFAWMLIFLHKKHEMMRISFRKMQFDRVIFLQSVRIGLPTGLQQSFVALGMMAVMGIVNTFGTNVIAAYTAAGRIDSFATMFAMNFSQALSAFTGQNLGAGKFHRIKTGYRKTLFMSNGLCLLLTILIIAFRYPLMQIFTNDADVIAIGAEYLTIVSMFYLFFSTMFVTNGVMRGAGATLIPMFITLFSLWIIRIPLAYILSGKLGYPGIWWSIPIAWFFGMAGAWIYYKSGKWKEKGVIKPLLDD